MNSLITAHSDELSKQYLPPDVIDEISNKIAVSLGIKN